MSSTAATAGSDDPFEIRVEFTDMVKKLTASQQSILKACSFALKHRDLHEILYDCIYDELKLATINARLNIFYLVDAICQSSRKINFNGYQLLFERDLLAIVRLCVPDDPTGSINLSSVSKIINHWAAYEQFKSETLKASKKMLAETKIIACIPRTTTDSSADTVVDSKYELGKSEILKRIEEDRERHKRVKEEQWIRRGTFDDEFDQQWDQLSDYNDKDQAFIDEYNRQRVSSLLI